MKIIKNHHWDFYCYQVADKGKIEYLHHDGSWKDSADYFKTQEEIENILKAKTPTFSQASVPSFLSMNIGVSTFARERHTPTSGKSYFNGSWDELIGLVKLNWNRATPGQGETGFTRKIVIPVPHDKFVGNTALLIPSMMLEAKPDRRQRDEDLFVSVKGIGIIPEVGKLHPIVPEPIIKAEVVLYSHAALTEHVNESSGDYDWEIVAILAKTSENEPMHSLTMARNFLEKTGGTKSVYTAQEFAEAIYYWSQRVSV